jgi:NAD(P)-dependent dehydrogenase (short-subunit alcohol dehydrogenase family)
MPSPIILVTAAGPNVGAAVSKKFADNGYKVTLAARSLSERIQSNGHLYVKADLSSSDTAPQIFHQVKKNHGIPNIVGCNGLASLRTFPIVLYLTIPGAHRLVTSLMTQFQHHSKYPESPAMSAWAVLILQPKKH